LAAQIITVGRSYALGPRLPQFVWFWLSDHDAASRGRGFFGSIAHFRFPLDVGSHKSHLFLQFNKQRVKKVVKTQDWCFGQNVKIQCARFIVAPKYALEGIVYVMRTHLHVRARPNK
jgi:hypothetical protein